MVSKIVCAYGFVPIFQSLLLRVCEDVLLQKLFVQFKKYVHLLCLVICFTSCH